MQSCIAHKVIMQVGSIDINDEMQNKFRCSHVQYQ